MNNNLSFFQTNSEYKEARLTLPEPNVSRAEDIKHEYFSYDEKNYLNEYLTFEVLSDGNICWKTWISGDTSYASQWQSSIQYSINDGEWQTITTSVDGSTFAVSKGDNVRFKGNSLRYTTSGTSQTLPVSRNTYVCSTFSGTTCNFNLRGNIMSLIYGDNFSGKTTGMGTWAFHRLFLDCVTLLDSKRIELPAKGAAYCYYGMFAGCSNMKTTIRKLPSPYTSAYCYNSMYRDCCSLTNAPELPSLSASGTYTYSRMFQGCSKLKKAPSLPYLKITSGCYHAMFSACTSLESVPELSVSSVTSPSTNAHCQYMFQGCTSLKYVPKLKLNTLGASSYNSMFFGCVSLQSIESVPITTVSSATFSNMFYNCKNLKIANIELPATTLGYNCYSNMFYGCSSLVNAPELPATTLSHNCYTNMFNGCTSLKKGPSVLPATTVPASAYTQMFYNCTSLETAPELPSTTLAERCYYAMFRGCTSLVNAPELPATTLANNCYQYMFCNCTSLVNAPKTIGSSAITMPISACSFMFSGCTSLEEAPVLLSPTLSNHSYSHMFRGCSKLNNIKCLATDISATYCTGSWVIGVASRGVFGKAPSMQGWSRGVHGIPVNWVIEDFVPYDQEYLTFEILEDNTYLHLTRQQSNGFLAPQITLQYSTDKSDWKTITSAPEPDDALFGPFSQGQKVYLKGNNSYTGYNMLGNSLKTNKSVNVYGNVFSLINATNFSQISSMGNNNSFFAQLFKDCTGLVDASNLILPSSALTMNCYYEMFDGCTSLVNAPKLPATNLGWSCYQNMFKDCTSLVDAPELPATTLIEHCYNSMFKGCTSLVNAPKLPATTLEYGCYNEMFYDCSSLVTSPSLPATTLIQDCYMEMFNGCTSLVNAPELPATTLADNCYAGMFMGCTSLVKAPKLPATNLTYDCYNSMFAYCTSLVTPPSLPATNLDYWCYDGMFYGCTSLLNPPELPATTLFEGCYNQMFYGCTSLTYAPELPATTLVDACYDNMFEGCSNLSYIKAMFTTTPSSAYTDAWVSGVSSTGTFIKNGSASWDVVGVDGVPDGWNIGYQSVIDISKMFFPISYKEQTNSFTVTNYSSNSWTATANVNWIILNKNTSNEFKDVVTFKIKQNPNITDREGTISVTNGSITRIIKVIQTDLNKNYLSFGVCNSGTIVWKKGTNSSDKTIQYSINGGEWTSITSTTAGTSFNVVSGDIVRFKGNNVNYTGGNNNLYSCFTDSTIEFELFGNVMSLFYLDDFEDKTAFRGGTVMPQMFRSCTGLTNADDLLLPATSLTDYCYYNLFYNCTSLKTVPSVIPATTLGNSCCAAMFGCCRSLKVAPELPATSYLANASYCYSNMFSGCTSLTTAPELPATTLANNCYQYMFAGCSSLEKGPSVLPATTLKTSCYAAMFFQCTSLKTAPELLFTEIVNSSASHCANMFMGCTSLVKAPELSATTLGNSSYSNMFYGCTALETAPSVLPATTIGNDSYGSMFSDCTSLVKAPEMYVVNMPLRSCRYMFRGCTSLVTGPSRIGASGGTSGNYSCNDMFRGCSKMVNAPELPSTTLDGSCYAGMFNGCTSLKTAPSVLPATTMANNCYNAMFRDCTSLVRGPEISATTLAIQCCQEMLKGCSSMVKGPSILFADTLVSSCYNGMFGGCTSLVTAPELPATTLVNNCYQSMFNGCTSLKKGPSVLPASAVTASAYTGMFANCTSLVTAPELPATVLDNNCYRQMFNNCTSLVNAPELPATTLYKNCYYQMFAGCSSLVNTPELPATTLEYGCYDSMFSNCTSLVNGPSILPATTLAERCYASMFRTCRSLVSAPKLPAETLVTNCYYYMFESCNKLNFIDANFLTTPSNTYTISWVNAVAAKGTFIKNPNATWTTTGSNAVPTQWTVESQPLEEQYLTFGIQQDGTYIEFVKEDDDYSPTVSIEYSTDKTNWTSVTATTDGTFFGPFANGNKVYLRGDNTCIGHYDEDDGDYYGNTLKTTSKVNVYGNIMSIINSTGFSAMTEITVDGMFYRLFEGCVGVVDASNLILPATTLANYCYASMFFGCTSLVNVPELPATTLNGYCYGEMFRECTSLVDVPELPATALADYCYASMFFGCTSLVNVPELPATNLAPYCYRYMFYNCTSLNYIKALFTTTPSNTYTQDWVSGVSSTGTFVKSPDATWNVIGTNGVPSGWTIGNTNDIIVSHTVIPMGYEYSTGSFTITNKTGIPWSATTNVDWIVLLNTSSSAYTDSIEIAVKPDIDEIDREGIITITNGSVNKTVKVIQTNIENNYLTFDIISGGTVVWKADSTIEKRTIEYSINGGNWTSITSTTAGTSFNVSSGDIVRFRGNYFNEGYFSEYSYFEVTSAKFNVYGNIMSLIYGDEFKERKVLPFEEIFDALFQDCIGLVDASKLILPALTLVTDCYNYMFANCTSLVIAPELPATTLVDGCYFGMFLNCTSLVNAPELPATTMTNNCYRNMFCGCTSLVNAPELPATTLKYSCYNEMFYGCTSLVNAPELPATTLADFCYAGMFRDCTSLVNAPELPSTTLADYCYSQMFRKCTSLVNAPELPATTLAQYCYYLMFENCTSLVIAPELPATTLVNNCYSYMFQGCSNLSYIKALFTTTPSNTYTQNWVYGVSSTGTFVKSPDATWNVIGTNGVPTTNWVIASELTTRIQENGTLSFKVNNVDLGKIDNVTYSRDGGHTWVENEITATTLSINLNVTSGETIIWRASASTLAQSTSKYCNFSSSCKFEVYGNIMSLLYGASYTGQTTLSTTYTFCNLFYNCSGLTNAIELSLPVTALTNYCYNTMFSNCKSLVSAPSIFPATTLVNYCYNGMFRGCSSLVNAPELPATTLADSCYNQMFDSCTSLVNAPELPATTLATNCYGFMFYNCKALVNAPSELPATTVGFRCYSNMFAGCTSLIRAPKIYATTFTGNESCGNMFVSCVGLTTAPLVLPATALTYGSYSRMFEGCSLLETAPELPATTLAQECYKQMFKNCTKLNYIKCLATDISATNCLLNWVNNVSSAGTFVKDISMTGWTTGVNGIPSGWTVEDYAELQNWTMVVDDFWDLNDEEHGSTPEEVFNEFYGTAVGLEYDSSKTPQENAEIGLEHWASDCEDGTYHDSNVFYLIDTIRYNGQDLWLWEIDNVNVDNVRYIITNPYASFSNFYSHSIAYDSSQKYNPIVAILNEDMEVVYDEETVGNKTFWYNKNVLITASEPSVPTIYMAIDDYPDFQYIDERDPSDFEDFYNTLYDENLTIEENVENVLSSYAEDCEDEADCHGSNVYHLIDTIEYDGNTCWLWEMTDEFYASSNIEQNIAYVITPVYSSFNDLYSHSIAYDSSQKYNPIYARLYDDKTTIYEEWTVGDKTFWSTDTILLTAWQ